MPRRRTLLALVVAVVVLLAGIYLYAGSRIYDQLSATAAHCGGRWPGNTPGSFAVDGLDTTPFETTSYQRVSLPSRGDGVTLNGWFEPAPGVGGEGVVDAVAAGDAVVVVHGQGSCIRDPQDLLAAGMLHRHGVAVLLIDMRNHGDSTIVNGRFAGGTNEYRDALGGWDWLVAHGFAPARVGLAGFSLGAGTVLIATGEEPRVPAVWEDSSWADTGVAIRAELARNGYPTWFELGGYLVARLVTGDDLATLSPIKAVRKMAGRPLAIVHGTADGRLSPQYALDLADAYRQGGGSVDPWLVAGAGHTQAIFDQPTEYERRLAAFFEAALAAPG